DGPGQDGLGQDHGPRGVEQAQKPSSPWRERSRYKNSPTTTGGSPMKVCRVLITASRPGNRRRARRAARGKAMAVASKRAAAETQRDSQTMPHSSPKSRPPKKDRRSLMVPRIYLKLADILAVAGQTLGRQSYGKTHLALGVKSWLPWAS